MLKNKIQPSKFEDLIGCIDRFQNLAQSHVVNREVLWRFVQNRGSYRKRGGTRKLLAKEKLACPAKGPIQQITSRVCLSGNSSLKFHSWEELKLQLSLGLQSWGQVTPPWACCFFLFSMWKSCVSSCSSLSSFAFNAHLWRTNYVPVLCWELRNTKLFKTSLRELAYILAGGRNNLKKKKGI